MAENADELDANELTTDPPKLATGTEGLDTVLGGGLPQGGMYLVRGGAGTGKTTLGLQFLLQGAREGQRGLYLTLSQTEAGLLRIVRSHGWTLAGTQVQVQELASADGDGQAAEQTLFHTADVELGETIRAFVAAVERLNPARVVFDSVTELSLLAGDSLRYRRQLLGLRQFLEARACTALLLDSGLEDGGEISSLTDGLIELEQTPLEHGNVRRLRVRKLRGAPAQGGHHNFQIRTGALVVFPQLLASGGAGVPTEGQLVASGVSELDSLLGGGLEAGTSCLFMGPSGTGKTTLATLYAHSAARRGERAAVFLFEESSATFYRRSASLGMDVRPLVAQGLLSVRQIDTAELSPGEFAHSVRQTVDEEGAKVVLIDSLSGYFHAMPQEAQLVTHMHELLSYLGGRGVLSLLVLGQHGVVGSDVLSRLDISYLADAVVLLRHFEASGELRKAVSVVKKRYGAHEHTIRELRLSGGRVRVGAPLREFSGVLTGTPAFAGKRGLLFGSGGTGLETGSGTEAGTGSETEAGTGSGDGGG